MTPVDPRPRPSKPAKSKARTAFYRQCRDWHAYLSAFAFLALMFFSATGLLLNHPEWFEGDFTPGETTNLVLSADDLAQAAQAGEPMQALAAIVGNRVGLRGAYRDGFEDGGTAIIRLEGVRGSSDVAVDLATGQTEATVQRAGFISIVNELHRGVESGAAWRLLIDIAAIVILVLSVLGYVLFFSLRFRLATSLVLTGASLALMIGLFVVAVP